MYIYNFIHQADCRKERKTTSNVLQKVGVVVCNLTLRLESMSQDKQNNK